MNKELSCALLKAQAQMGRLIKDSNNPHFKNKYASLAAVLETVRGPLTDAGIVLYQSASAAEGGVMVRSMLIHAESGESIEEVLPLPVAQQTPQAYGSAITYGRRYLAMAMCGLAPDDDDGNEGSQQKQAYQPVVKSPVAQHRTARPPAPVSIENRSQIDTTLDEIDVEDSEPMAFDEEPPTKVRDWLATDDPVATAKAWAVACKAQANEHAARNSLKEIVDAQGGRLTKDNMYAILTAYYFRQVEHMSDARGVAVA